MTNSELVLWGIAAAVILGFLIAMYNHFIIKRNNVDNAFAAIDAQLKQRIDLVPNLVAAVREYTRHESETLMAITTCRSQAMAVGSNNITEKLKYGMELSGLMRNILIQAESYPDLKANGNFLHLQRSLNEIEAQLSAARRTYNAAVTEYNTAIQFFPNCIFASLFGFSPRPLFEAAEAERINPDVQELFRR